MKRVCGWAAMVFSIVVAAVIFLPQAQPRFLCLGSNLGAWREGAQLRSDAEACVGAVPGGY